MERAAIPEVRKRAEDSFASGLYCAESVVMAIAKAEGVDSELLPRIATGFGGGMARTCGDCGALTGAIMAVGLAFGRSAATESVEPTFAATRRLIRDFEREFGARNCQALLSGCDLATPEGQAMFNEQKLRRRCLRFTGGAAEIAARVIVEAQGRPERPNGDNAKRSIFTTGRTTMSEASIKDIVRDKYAEAARRVGTSGSCCGAQAALVEGVGGSCCGTRADLAGADPITSNLYGEDETSALPEAAVLASLGCGNPTALAELKPGETVLDLGSGGGIDVLLSARRVGPEGKAYGLDMTDEMLALARDNQRKAGATNVEFLKGEIENIPLPDNSVDVIVSNCVINLSADKDRVLREAFRVLKPGGRFAVSDVVTRGEVPEQLRKDMLLWVGCIAGALEEGDYRAKLAAAGFERIGVEPTRVYRVEDARDFLAGKGLDVDALASEVDGKFMSAFVRAVKPQAPAKN